MNPHRTRDTILTLIGFAAVLIYILACAAFSPDDSKILYPTFEPATGSLTLSVYDRTSRTTDSVLVLPVKETGWVRPGWTPDGRKVVALWADKSSNERLQVGLIPFRNSEPARLLTVADVDEVTSNLFYPPQLLGSSLFLTGAANVVRLDLDTGAVTEEKVGEDVEVVARQGRLFYHRKLPAEGAAPEDRWEVGRLDTDTLQCTPIFQTSEGDTQGLIVPDADGSRIALETKTDDVFKILLFEGKNLLRAIPFGTESERLVLGSLAWSRDGSTLYAVYAKPLSDGDRHQFGVMELPVGGGPDRRTPLFTAGGLDDSDPGSFQFEVSHDGKTIAGASTYLWSEAKPKIAAGDLALYLIDLTSPDRKVTKVPITPPKPRSGMEKK